MKFTDICFLTPDVGRLRAFYEAVFQTRSEGDDFHATLSAGGLAFTFDSAVHLATTDAFSYAEDLHPGAAIVSFDVDDADAEFAPLKAMGVATLRVDGFASVGGLGQAGTLTTKPLVLKGKSLWVNADARDGTLRVEVLPIVPQSRAQVAGLDPKTCLPLTTDGVRQEIRWKNVLDLSPVCGKPVQLRFHLNNARLYSFWME